MKTQANLDHFMVTVTLRQNVKKALKNKATKTKWNSELTNYGNSRFKYADYINKTLKKLCINAK